MLSRIKSILNRKDNKKVAPSTNLPEEKKIELDTAGKNEKKVVPSAGLSQGEEIHFGTGFEPAESDAEAAGKAIKKVEESVPEAINKPMPYTRSADPIIHAENDAKSTKIIDATIKMTFDQESKITPNDAVTKVASWLYGDSKCKVHFREYNANKGDVAYYLSKAVLPHVKENSPGLTFVKNLFTPGFKHYYTDPSVEDDRKDALVTSVQNECNNINKILKINK